MFPLHFRQYLTELFRVLLASVMLFGSLSATVLAKTDTALWRMADDQNKATIDHSAWNAFLKTYLVTDHADGINRVRYAEVSEPDRRQLQRYIASLANIDPREFARKEQMAYWINLYNAITIELILKNYPVESITSLGEKFFAFGPWDDPMITVAGETLTLNDIEHQILRPIWQDPRIHYAVNCASIGCPNLNSEAFTGENLETLLDQGARAYVGHPRGLRFEAADEIVVSKIYDWFVEDFGDSESGVLKHLADYADENLAEKLRRFRGDIDYEYDWSLNGANTGS